MKLKLVVVFAFIVFSVKSVIAQKNNSKYVDLIAHGWKLYKEKDLVASVKIYEKAFKLNNNVPLGDRFTLSYMYTLSGNKDSAIHQIFIIANEYANRTVFSLILRFLLSLKILYMPFYV
jgi:hypothetical protein